MARGKIASMPACDKHPRRVGQNAALAKFGKNGHDLARCIGPNRVHSLRSGIQAFRLGAVGEDHFVPVKQQVVIHHQIVALVDLKTIDRHQISLLPNIRCAIFDRINTR